MNIIQVIGAVAIGAVVGGFAGVKLAQYLIAKRVKSIMTLLTALQAEETASNNSLLTIDKDK